MGPTHALSAVAGFLALIAFAPSAADKLIGTSNIWAVILAGIVTAGASLVPDLDNTSSTSRNSLGPFGALLSYIFRGSSIFLQTVIRTSRDDPEPNPHRGAWHTVPAALLLGFLTFLGTKIGGSVTLPIIGQLSWGQVFALFISFIMCHLALSGLAADAMRSIKKSSAIGEVIAFGISFAITVTIFAQIPHDIDFWWLGFSVFFGCFIHVLGDCFTTAGAPILFPITGFTRKKKFWWTTRFTSIKAGGVVEKTIFMPAFGIICIICLIKIFAF